MAAADAIPATLLVIDALESLGVPYHIGGSLASSVHGLPRQTRDGDLVADLMPGHVSRLAVMLRPHFFVDESMMRDAVRQKDSFNVIHLETGFKIDIYLLGDSDFDEVEFNRHRTVRLREDPPRDVFVKSAEDIVLRKLLWYRAGGEVSDRQWNDVRGVLDIQRSQLDLAYLRLWARRLGIESLLTEAFDEAGGFPAE